MEKTLPGAPDWSHSAWLSENKEPSFAPLKPISKKRLAGLRKSLAALDNFVAEVLETKRKRLWSKAEIEAMDKRKEDEDGNSEK